jgi:hypothetical protein
VAEPRVNGIRVYFNDDEVEAIKDLAEGMSISDSSAIRYMMTVGLNALRHAQREPVNLDVANASVLERLTTAMSEPGERNRTPILRSA